MLKHVKRGQMNLKNLCRNFFCFQGAARMGQLHGGSRVRSPGWSAQRQGQGLHSAGHSATVPKQDRLLADCSHQHSRDSKQCEMTSWIWDLSRKFSQKHRRQHWGYTPWSCGLLQEFHSAIQDKRRGDCAQLCTQHRDLPELQWNSCTGRQSLDRNLRKGCWGHPGPRNSSQKERNIS